MAGEKDIYRKQIIDFLANDDDVDGQMFQACHWHKIVGLRGPGALYYHFDATERAEIAKEALDVRRQRMHQAALRIDRALAKQAEKGDIQAAKLFYQRLEGWSEKIVQQHGGEITFVLADSRRPETKPPEITIGARTNEPEKV